MWGGVNPESERDPGWWPFIFLGNQSSLGRQGGLLHTVPEAGEELFLTRGQDGERRKKGRAWTPEQESGGLCQMPGALCRTKGQGSIGQYTVWGLAKEVLKKDLCYPL